MRQLMRSWDKREVPNVPFMIALGTSHTNGDCGHSAPSRATFVEKTVWMRVAEELGLELINVGLSGCGTHDMLQATNELAHYGFLNDNCKLFVLEPRINDSSVIIPFSADSENGHVINSPPGSNKSWLLDDRDRNYKLPPRRVLEWDQQPGLEMEPDTHMANQIVGHSKHPSNYSFADTLEAKVIYEASAFVNDEPIQWLGNINIIDAIHHIVTAHGVKFKWQLMAENESLHLGMSRLFIEAHTTLFEKMIPGVVMPVLSEQLDKEHDASPKLTKRKDLEKTIKCSCGHLNDAGHKRWYELTIDHLR